MARRIGKKVDKGRRWRSAVEARSAVSHVLSALIDPRSTAQAHLATCYRSLVDMLVQVITAPQRVDYNVCRASDVNFRLIENTTAGTHRRADLRACDYKLFVRSCDSPVRQGRSRPSSSDSPATVRLFERSIMRCAYGTVREGARGRIESMAGKREDGVSVFDRIKAAGWESVTLSLVSPFSTPIPSTPDVFITSRHIMGPRRRHHLSEKPTLVSDRAKRLTLASADCGCLCRDYKLLVLRMRLIIIRCETTMRYGDDPVRPLAGVLAGGEDGVIRWCVERRAVDSKHQADGDDRTLWSWLNRTRPGRRELLWDS